MASGEPVSEAALAGLLADVLADSQYWAGYETATSDVAVRAIGRRAADLYYATGLFIEQNRLLDPAGSQGKAVGKAIAAMREIADWAVLVSYSDDYRTGESVVPSRRAFEWLLRLDDVDSWAAKLGYRLSIADEIELPDEMWTNLAERDLPEVEDFLGAWGHLARAYEKVLDPSRRDQWERLAAEAGPSIEGLRESTADLIFGARVCLVWAQGKLPVLVQPLAVAGVLMMQSMFAATWVLPDEGIVVPAPDVIIETIRGSDALDWLSEQGAEIPDWLT